MNAIKTWKIEVQRIEHEWMNQPNRQEINDEYSEKRLFVFERIAQLKGEPIL